MGDGMNDGTLNIVVAGFPYNDINVIVEILAETATMHAIPTTGMSLNTRDTFGLRPSSYHLRLGAAAHGAYIPNGEGDVLLGLEAGCAARSAAETMGGHGVALVNTWQYHPPHLVTYPSVGWVLESLERLLSIVIPVDAIRLGELAGDRRIAQGLVDMSMLGALAGIGVLPFAAGDVARVIASRYRMVDDGRVLNAFHLGVAESEAMRRRVPAPIGVARRAAAVA